MPVFGFFGGILLRLANRGSRLAARGSDSQARKIASPTHNVVSRSNYLWKLLEERLHSNIAQHSTLMPHQNFRHFFSVSAYRNCGEIYQSGERKDGLYAIKPDNLSAFDVFCDQTTAGGGWTVFQKRLNGSVDFFPKLERLQSWFWWS